MGQLWNLALVALAVGLFAWKVAEGYRNPLPRVPPMAPLAGLTAREWLAVPFQAGASLAGLLWLAIAVLVFMAPLVALVWWLTQ